MLRLFVKMIPNLRFSLMLLACLLNILQSSLAYAASSTGICDPNNPARHTKVTFREQNDILYYDECSGSCSSSSNATLPGDNNAERAYNYLVAHGFSPEQAAGIVGKNGSAAETIFPDKAGTNWITADSASTENMHPWTALIPYVVGCVDLRKRYFQTSVSDWIHLRHFHGWLSWGNIRNP